MSDIPEGLYYSEKHEWLKLEENGVISLGITDFAQSALGDIVYVDASPADTEFDNEDSIGTIESVKAAEELYAPLDGKVVEINESLKDAPESVNTAPYTNWILKITNFKESDLSNMMDAPAYQIFLDSLK